MLENDEAGLSPMAAAVDMIDNRVPFTGIPKLV